ncbi:TIGR02996 domain-containing protein [Gemmata sp. JC717]|uniref:DUF6948 domain-containing protein n=1 Tax=Gemmata algarum TaxID=2975278 RepID=UPI0021BBA151|nr:TIGR02996 domain-containing protein [Gemmata algarum]MDY3554793.1 TIGR02996 domain-containing protein [Gemmata algarum]
MTVEEAALLRAIAAHPGEVTARLAYADWLDEHGRGLEAAWVRDEGTAPPWVTVLAYGRDHTFGNFSGHGHDDGYGFGCGDSAGGGDGYSHGDGDGDGDGDGAGRGDGSGHGNGCGNDRGDGNGYGCGNSNGRGNGNGNGHETRAPRELHHLISHEDVPMPSPGTYVIVRSRDQGCVCGEYRGHHGREVVLSKARQIYSWEGGRLTLIDFAVVPGPCRLSREAPGEVVMLEACGIIPTTPEVEAFLRAHPGE